ncbi:MAG: choice-of-anchor J domain-containing protein, partial [Ignavibacteria bacterium]|nr:choice-of-anchor J domain-containing protein [Ignavibacteria bacterium]
MRKSKIFSIILTFLIIGIALGFTNTNSGNFNDKADKYPKSTFLSRSQTNSELNSNKNNLVFDKLSILQNLNDNNGIPATTFGSPYYTDNFDGANDTVSLKSRGYKVYFRGTGIQDPATPTWFQGNPTVFNSFNGPANGYVSSYYRTVTGINNIDNWLVLPKKNIASTDSIFFYQRSFFNSTYADSIRVMYSAAGDSTPESISWVELGRFRANFTTNNWVKVGFKAASAGANARYAIRYSVVNGGPSGVNSDVIGIDALSLELTQLTADVGVQSLNSPSGTIGIPSAAIIPNATIKNFGTATQTFNVTMTINPAGYS